MKESAADPYATSSKGLRGNLEDCSLPVAAAAVGGAVQISGSIQDHNVRTPTVGAVELVQHRLFPSCVELVNRSGFVVAADFSGAVEVAGRIPVSYTHLDVYKRQNCHRSQERVRPAGQIRRFP